MPKATVRPTIDSLINVHGSPRRGLRVCGKHFTDVIGTPPFWMPVPNTPFILFARRLETQDRILVMCDTNTCTFDEIPLYRTFFGNQIGRQPTAPDNWGDIVESVKSNKVVLRSTGAQYVEKSVLDLDERSIRVIEFKNDAEVPLEFPQPFHSP